MNSNVKIRELDGVHIGHDLNDMLAGSDGWQELAAAASMNIFCTDQARQLDGITQFRKLLTQRGGSPIDNVIACGVIPCFIRLLKRDHSMIQVEAARTLGIIASGTTTHTQVLISHGAIPELIPLLFSPVVEVCQRVLWALGNIAGSSLKHRDHLLELGITCHLLAVLGMYDDISIRRTGSRLIRKLCQGEKSQANRELISPAIILLKNYMFSSDDEILINTCWAISDLSSGSDDDIQEVVEAGICKRLVKLLAHASVSVQTPALLSVGKIVTGTDRQTQAVIDQKVLPALLRLLSSLDDGIRRWTCWTISNILAGSPNQIQAVFKAGIVPPLLYILQYSDFTSKKEACRAICNATLGGTQVATHIRRLISLGCIKPLCNLLTTTDDELVQIVLGALENFLRIGGMDIPGKLLEPDIPCVIEIIEAGAEVVIANLRFHSSPDIHKKALSIINMYFPDRHNGDWSI